MALAPGSSPVLVSVVDDDSSVRRALRRLIGSAGFAVETFASGPEYLDSDPCDRSRCLVLDIHLGDMSGFDVQERLAAAGARIPIIFITAHDDDATRARAAGLGAVAYLRKPFDERALMDAIGRAINRESTGP